MNIHALNINTANNAINTRTMLVSINISQWQGRMLDRRVTSEINDIHNATSDAGRYNKLLLNPKAFRKINSIAGRIRNGFYERTLPWMDDGQRIMSAHSYPDFVAWFNTEATEFHAAKEEFIADYPAYRDERHKELGDMYNPYDYPSVEDLATKFSLTRTIMPVPSGQDFRVDIAQAQVDQIRDDIERNVQTATMNAINDVYTRLSDVTSRMFEKLENYKPSFRVGDKAEGIFRDSLVENVRDLIKVLPALNITNDTSLFVIGKRMEALVRHDAEELRLNSHLRKSVAEEAKAINKEINNFLA
ncbi:hypothetical protein [Bartonella choladocola]|uniref:Uncharacterized protein n=1 Tax=Bartonella choladocola TaxID=2750995 RepID=A0A1U9MJV6_9HYPH|nr:hypothetical protein [Bartonella choladocola]AQT48000.1 hypothetical protein BBC0122_019050 [Bartonella choladocola]